jgi:hypothetical protein
MKKIITVIVFGVLATTTNAQEKKSKTTIQYRSAESGKYITKQQAKSQPSTTYSTKRRR